ncbi:hypothetical protein [Halovulum sp. GXIMD14793]
MLILMLLLIAGIACVALTIYWLARGFIWDPKIREEAVKNAKIDAVLALFLLVPVYAIAALNHQNCWVDGSVELPGLKYRCDDGVRKKHWSQYDWEESGLPVPLVEPSQT